MQERPHINLLIILPAEFDIDRPRLGITELLEVFATEMPRLGVDAVFLTPTEERCTSEVALRNSQYLRIPRPFAKKGILDVLGMMLFYKDVIKYYLKKHETFDAILVRDDPVTVLIIALLKKSKFIFQYSFPIIHESISEGPWYSTLYQRMRIYFLGYALRRSSLILPISRTLKDGLINEGFGSERMHILPMGVSEEQFSDASPSSVHNGSAVNETVELVYLGTMSKPRKLSIIIHAFAKCHRRHPESKLIMIGDGDAKEELQSIVDSLNLNASVSFTGLLPQEDAKRIMLHADIGLSIVPPTREFIPSSPTKLFEYMAASLPVIANRGIVEHEDILQNSHSGILVEYSEAAIADAMIKLVEDSNMRMKYGYNGHDWVISNRTYKAISEGLSMKLYSIFRTDIGMN